MRNAKHGNDLNRAFVLSARAIVNPTDKGASAPNEPARPLPRQGDSGRSSLSDSREKETVSSLVNSPLLIFCLVVYVSFNRRRGSSDLKEQIVKERKDDTATESDSHLKNCRTEEPTEVYRTGKK